MHGKQLIQGGTSINAGHPQVYINVNTEEPSVCKWCGLRYMLKKDHWSSEND